MTQIKCITFVKILLQKPFAAYVMKMEADASKTVQ